MSTSFVSYPQPPHQYRQISLDIAYQCRTHYILKQQILNCDGGTTMNHKSNYIIAVIVVFILTSMMSSSASAFDGNRKGFVFGIGLGGSPATHWKIPDIDSSGTAQGIASGILIGYSWNDANMLVYGNDHSLYFTDARSASSLVVFALSWYHYWGEDSKWYTKLGLGKASVGAMYRNTGGDGFGMVVGGGYEIFKQVQLGANFFGGKGSDAGNYSATAYSITFTATVIAY
jgi:hypothetical protein